MLDIYVVDSQQWKSNLKDAGDTVSKFLQPLNCELVSKTSPSRCSSWDITEENVSQLLTERAQNCTVTSGSCRTRLFNAPSVSAADSFQDVSKRTAEDHACKWFVDLCVQNWCSMKSCSVQYYFACLYREWKKIEFPKGYYV